MSKHDSIFGYIRDRFYNLFFIIFLTAFLYENWKTLLYIFKESNATKTIEFLNEYPFKFPWFAFFIVFAAYVFSIIAAKGLENIVERVKAFIHKLEVTPLTESYQIRSQISGVQRQVATQKEETRQAEYRYKAFVRNEFLSRNLISPHVEVNDLEIFREAAFSIPSVFYSRNGKEAVKSSFEEVVDRRRTKFYLCIHNDGFYTVGLELNPKNAKKAYVDANYFKIKYGDEKEFYFASDNLKMGTPEPEMVCIKFHNRDDRASYSFSHNFF